VKRVVAFLVVALVAQVAAFADVPLPGHHSVAPKYWPSIRRWVTNYSPFVSNAPIVALTADDRGGAWFGAGSTVEHIDGDGKMKSYVISSEEWLWQVQSIARDASGKLWFWPPAA
jgi:hypothetical protein